MTNEEYLKWEPLVKRIAYKYKNNSYRIEESDLIQIGSMGLLKGFENYNSDKNCSLKTWLYSSTERAILRVFGEMKRIKRQVTYESISLNTPIGTDDDTYLEDIIKDENINIEDIVIDKLIVEEYKKEINNCLRGKEKDIVYKTLFENKRFSQLSIEYGLSSSRIREIQKTGFRHLKHKSKMVRNRWLKIKENELEKNFLSAYNNPETVYFNIETSANLIKKYSKEIEILNLIQTLMDSFLLDYKLTDEIKTFIIHGLKNLIGPMDMYILKKYKFEKISIQKLEEEGFCIVDILNCEDKIKKIIIKNKDHVYDLWKNFRNTTAHLSN